MRKSSVEFFFSFEWQKATIVFDFVQMFKVGVNIVTLQNYILKRSHNFQTFLIIKLQT